MSIFKYFVLKEYNEETKKEEQDNIDKSDRLSQQAKESKDRFEKSLLELDELLKKNQNA